MSDDIIIVVPPGTRVRYIENPHVEQILVVDAHQLRPYDDVRPTFTIGPPLDGTPVFDAEPWDAGVDWAHSMFDRDDPAVRSFIEDGA